MEALDTRYKIIAFIAATIVLVIIVAYIKAVMDIKKFNDNP